MELVYILDSESRSWEFESPRRHQLKLKMKYNIKRSHIKTISFDFNQISNKPGNKNANTLKDFDFYFVAFQDFLQTKEINVQKNDSLNVELYFISKKPLEDNLIKQLLDDGLFETFNFTNSEDITTYLDVVYNKAMLDSKLEVKTSNVKSFSKI